MKYFIILLCAMFVDPGFATTVNYNWLVDGINYAQTTCETGDDLILPTPAPTKYGYHLVGWVESEIFGSCSQSGTPTPQTPIEPVFTAFGNTVLRALGSGGNFIADSYDPETRTITRRIGIKVLDGTENWIQFTNDLDVICSRVLGGSATNTRLALSNALYHNRSHLSTSSLVANEFFKGDNTSPNMLYVNLGTYTDTTINNWKTFLADQYDAGTPVTIYYPLATPQQESLQQ